jgi:DNA repair protein SbcC/Rad50
MCSPADAADARRGLDEAEQAGAAAREALREAQATLDALRRAQPAHVLRGALAVGQPCPVCAQGVTAVPARHEVEGLDAAAPAVTTAPGRLATAEDQVRLAVIAVATAQEAARAQGAAVQEAGADIAGIGGETRRLLPRVRIGGWPAARAKSPLYDTRV